MTGDWTVQLDDGAHRLHADVSYTTGRMTITWDDLLLASETVLFISGDIKTFNRDGHLFVLSVKGPWYFGHLELSIDGRSVAAGAVPTTFAPQIPPRRLDFVQEQNVTETEEIIAIDDFPLDNSYGTDPLSTERQVSKEVTNELTVEDSNHLSGSLGADFLHALKAEVEAQVCRQTGSKVGEKVVETQVVKFTVGSNKSVVYQVIWKRKIRKGEQVYLFDGQRMITPYKLNYGLSFEVRTVAPKKAAG